MKKEVLLKATHDSATGEKPKGILSYIVLPFSRTQSKTIAEQFNVGVRYFDIRVRIVGDKWYCAHGLFLTKSSADYIFATLNSLGEHSKEPVYVNITYEGWGDKRFLPFVLKVKEKYPYISICCVNQKYSEGIKLKWKTLKIYNTPPKSEDKFVKLDFRDWKTFIPIPWLWKKIYYNVPEFNTESFTFVDFI